MCTGIFILWPTRKEKKIKKKEIFLFLPTRNRRKKCICICRICLKCTNAHRKQNNKGSKITVSSRHTQYNEANNNFIYIYMQMYDNKLLNIHLYALM